MRECDKYGKCLRDCNIYFWLVIFYQVSTMFQLLFVYIDTLTCIYTYTLNTLHTLFLAVALYSWTYPSHSEQLNREVSVTATTVPSHLYDIQLLRSVCQSKKECTIFLANDILNVFNHKLNKVLWVNATYIAKIC